MVGLERAAGVEHVSGTEDALLSMPVEDLVPLVQHVNRCAGRTVPTVVETSLPLVREIYDVFVPVREGVDAPVS